VYILCVFCVCSVCILCEFFVCFECLKGVFFRVYFVRALRVLTMFCLVLRVFCVC